MKHLIFHFKAMLLIGIIIFCNTCSSVKEKEENPNILFILVDDMGWSDLGCYGGEISTPNIDMLAQNGLRFTQFYNTAKCMSSRGCLLTGLYAQQCGMGKKPEKLINSVTLGEVLKTAGYRTLASGKHHGTDNLFERGFDHYYGLRDGCCNFWNPGIKRDGEAAPGNKGRIRYWCDDEKTYDPYTPEDPNFYTTDAFTNKALKWLDEEEMEKKPFFLYLAYTAPHYPLHAWPEDIAKYKGKYDEGYESIIKARYDRMVKMGLVDPVKSPLPEWDGDDFKKLSGIELEKEILRMEIYAAMLDRVDQNIGKILAKLKNQNKLENTIIMFAADNGGCAEKAGYKTKSDDIKDYGNVASYEAVGRNWATVQNTPLRKWKNYTHEGGIRTPLIIHWPGKIKNVGGFSHEPGHLIDIMPTLVELSGANYPENYNDKEIYPMQGISILDAIKGNQLKRDKPIFWQWSKGGGIRSGDMKAVFWSENNEKRWELYDMSKNLNETDDLASKQPEQLESLEKQWQEWYNQVIE